MTQFATGSWEQRSPQSQVVPVQADQDSMEITEIRRARSRRDKARNRRALLLGVVTGGLLLVLTAGIFGIIFESRDVSTESSRLNAYSEIVRATTVGRAQLGFAIVLDEVNGEVDTGAAALDAANDAEQSLNGLDEATTTLDTDLQALDSEAQTVLTAFVETGRILITHVRSGDGVPAQSVADFEVAYDAARDVAVDRRAAALDELHAADGSLNRLGALVSFVVAFVVPSAAVAIYRALSRPPRDLLETEARLVRDEVRSALRRDLLIGELKGLQAHLAASSAGKLQPSDAARRVDDIERTYRTLEHAQRCDFQSVNVAAQIDRVANESNSSRTETRVVTNIDGPINSWTEPDVLQLLLSSIIRDCEGRSAKTLAVSAKHVADHVAIRVVHDGLLRSPAELTRISEQQTTSGRLSLLGSNDIGLLTALHLADDLRGSLTVEEESGRQVVVLQLPLAPSTVAASP